MWMPVHTDHWSHWRPKLIWYYSPYYQTLYSNTKNPLSKDGEHNVAA